MAFPNAAEQLATVAVSASRVASAFMRFYGDWFTRPYFREGKVKLFPWPALSLDLEDRLEAFVRSEAKRRRASYQGHEPFFDFTKPFCISRHVDDAGVTIDWGSLLGPDLESAVEHAYGLNSGEAAELYIDLDEAVSFRSSGGDAVDDSEDDDDEGGAELVLDTSERGSNESCVSHAFGCTFGRWDIRYATGERAAPELPDPFEPLPVCPLGQLQNALGFPADPDDVPDDYRVRIPWDGILVDDPGHPLDIERRVREVIEIIWGGSAKLQVAGCELQVVGKGKELAAAVAEPGVAAADSSSATPESIEQEACEILGVRSLREYFQKPTKFFADHLKRYSKSRRQAPIYWPLSTESCGYTLWIYYHRVTDQTLFHAVNNFVEPKLKQVTEDLTRLKAKSGRSSAEEKELSKLTELASELTDFRDELLRVAKFWKPNLNDGVLITASPLWKLFRLPKWRKDLKACWEELEQGDYDWAHLALTIWPDRVVRTAHKDRSIAIAHDLETELWHEVTVTKPGKGKNAKPTTKTEWQPKKLSEAELDKIVQQVKQRPYASS